MNVVRPELADVVAAIEIYRRYQFSIWDALIVRAALIAGCETLYSEDFQDGSQLEGVRFLNPLRAGSREEWLESI